MADDATQAPFNDEQVNSIRQIVSTIVNSAIATRDKMADKKREQDRAAMTADFAKLLEEKLKPPPGDEPTEPGGKPGKGGKADDATVRELTTIRRQMEQLTKTSEENAQRAAAERAKNREAAMRGAVSEALDPLGINGIRFKAAYALLQQSGRIKYAADDSDDLIFLEEGTGAEIDYRPGLATWAKSDEAKIFLPPSGTQGAGTRPPARNPQIKNGPVTPQERTARINAALSDWADRGGT